MAAPMVRVDADYWTETYLYVAEQMLLRMADLVNELTRAGRIYTQIVLPPEEQAAKRAAMNGGG